MAHPTEPLLQETLEHQAADAADQEKYLRELGTWPSPDELALGLDDVAGASEAWMSPELAERVRLLDQNAKCVSGQEHADM